MHRPGPKQTPTSVPDDWAIIWKTLATPGVFIFSLLFNLFVNFQWIFLLRVPDDCAGIWSPKKYKSDWGEPWRCGQTLFKCYCLWDFEITVRVWGLRQGYPSLPPKMAPLRVDLSVSWPYGAKAIISVCSSSCLSNTYRLHIYSLLFLLSSCPLNYLVFTSLIFYLPLVSISTSMFSPLPSPSLLVLFLSVSPSAMRPYCQGWLFWFECSTCGWNLRPAALPSHRPCNGALAQENKPLFLVQSVDG